MDSTSTLLSTWLTSALPSTYPLLLQSESELKHFQTSEKRERIQELNECRELLFNVQTKLKTYGLRGYEPPEGLRGEVGPALLTFGVELYRKLLIFVFLVVGPGKAMETSADRGGE